MTRAQRGPHAARRTRSRWTPARRRHHRHLRRRPRRTPSGCWPTRRPSRDDLDPARPRLPAARRDGGVLRPRRATPRPPSTWPGSPACARPACIVEIVNDDGTMMRAARAARVRRRARPADDLDRGPDRATAAAPSASVERAAETAAAHRATASSRASATAAPSTASSTSRWSTATSATASDVLVRVHSECLTGDVFGSLRCDCGPQLDAALARGRRRGPRRRALPARPRGPRHRPAAQAAGLRAAGRAAATPSTPTSSSACPPTPATTAPARRSCRPRRRARAAADQQPGQARRPRGLRARGHRPGAAAGPRRPSTTCATCAPSATGWATTCPADIGRVTDLRRPATDARASRRERHGRPELSVDGAAACGSRSSPRSGTSR